MLKTHGETGQLSTNDGFAISVGQFTGWFTGPSRWMGKVITPVSSLEVELVQLWQGELTHVPGVSHQLSKQIEHVHE